MQSITSPGAKLGLSPISIGLIIAGGLFFVIVLVVRATILQPSSIDAATAAGAASVQLPLQNNVADALPAFSLQPTVQPTAGSGLELPRAPVYLMDATATPLPMPPTPLPMPTPVSPQPQPSAYQVTGSYEQRAVMTPTGGELCGRFGIDLAGNPLYFGSNDTVAQWFYGGGPEHRRRVVEACRRGGA